MSHRFKEERWRKHCVMIFLSKNHLVTLILGKKSQLKSSRLDSGPVPVPFCKNGSPMTCLAQQFGGNGFLADSGLAGETSVSLH